MIGECGVLLRHVSGHHTPWDGNRNAMVNEEPHFKEVDFTALVAVEFLSSHPILSCLNETPQPAKLFLSKP